MHFDATVAKNPSARLFSVASRAQVVTKIVGETFLNDDRFDCSHLKNVHDRRKTVFVHRNVSFEREASEKHPRDSSRVKVRDESIVGLGACCRFVFHVAPKKDL